MNVTVNDLATRWRASLHSPPLHVRTLETYDTQYRQHVLPYLGATLATAADRLVIRDYAGQLIQRVAPRTARGVLGVLSAVFASGIDAGHLTANPCDGLAKALRLHVPRDDKVKAMDAAQLGRFLTAVQASYPACYPLFLTLARTGLRLGECLALQREDVDLVKRQLRVRASLDPRGRRGPTKTGRERYVDLSKHLCSVLHAEGANVQPQEEAHHRPERHTEQQVFPISRAHAQYVMARVCRLAGLPRHSPHHLRHTYASLLAVNGVPLQYIQRQLGHASIGITADLYSRWLAMRGLEHVDKLDT